MNQQQNPKSTMKMAQEMVEFPMDQVIEYQSNLGRLMLSGLTMSDWVQSQGVEMTRRTIDTYLRTLQNAAEQISQNSTAAASTARQAEPGMMETAWNQMPQSRQTVQGNPQPQQFQQQPHQQTPQQGTTPYRGPPQQIPQDQQPRQRVPQGQQHHQEFRGPVHPEPGIDQRQENPQQAENPRSQRQ